MNFLFNVLVVVVRRGLVGPPKDFQGGPDACVHLTCKPVLSKCSNLRKRSRGALRGALRGTLRGVYSWSAATFSHIFSLRVLTNWVLSAMQFFTANWSKFSWVSFYEVFDRVLGC